MEQTPILLIIFNRPDKAKALIDALRPVRPAFIYVSADGPREGNASDAVRCVETRAMIDQIDWPCTVVKNFHEKNTGADFGPEKAINWFFENVEEGIILEDDCNPHPDFLNFSSTLLERYRDDLRVMHIAGSNFQKGIKRGDSSYYFSLYPSTWGWATWRRAWKFYDTNTSSYPEFLSANTIDEIVQSKNEKNYWLKFFKLLHTHELEHWDIKWIFAVWANHGLCITPNVNLIKNIGFGVDATHTFRDDGNMVNETAGLGPITHPGTMERNAEADAYLFQNIYAFTLKKKILYALELAQRKLGIIK